MKLVISYHADSEGYSVTVSSLSGIVKREYTAGNSPFDSAAITYGAEHLPLTTLWRYAESTAKEMAEELVQEGHKVLQIERA